MYTHDIRWYALVPVAVLIALVHVFVEAGDFYPAFAARPDWLLALAFTAALHTPPAQALAAFAFCGLVRDLFWGPSLGAALGAYVVVGYVTLSWRLLAEQRNYAYRCLLVGVSCFLASLLRHSLDYGLLTYKLVDSVFFLSLGDAVLTFAAYIPFGLLLGLDSFRPWKERSGY